MPTFELEAPDGQVYEIEAQDEASALKAVEHAFGGQQSQASPDGAPDPEIAAYTGEVLSGDPNRARAAIVQNEYEQMPWYQKPLVAADDIVRLTANGISSGFVDKIGGKISEATGIGPTTEERRQNTQDARDRAGWAGTTGEIAGAIYGADKLLKGGRAVLGGAKALPAVGGAVRTVANGAANLAARPGAVGFATRTLGAGATGAGLGALNAAGHDQDVGEGAKMGAIFGAAGNALGEGAAKVVDKVAGGIGRVAGVNRAPQIMTTEELKAASRAAYQAADDAGVIVKPTAMQRLAKELEDTLGKGGYAPELSGEVDAVLRHVNRISQGNVTLEGVDILRQVAGAARGSQNANTRRLGEMIADKVDDFLENLNAGDILAGGNRTQGVRALQEARRLWASAKKSEMIMKALEDAKNQAAAAHSGGNIDNAIRQQFKAILKDAKKSRGLTKDERAAMLLIVRGKTGEGLLRSVAKLSPNGSGLMAILQLGGVGALGPAALAAPIAGIGAKTIADSLTPARVEQLSRIVRAGGNASATQAAPNMVQRLARQNSGALTLPLTVGGIVGSD